MRCYISFAFIFLFIATTVFSEEKYGIYRILHIDSYMNGGGFSLVAQTDKNEILFIYIDGDNNEGKSTIAFLDGEDLISNVDLLMSVLVMLSAWKEGELNGISPDQLIKKYEEGEEIPSQAKQALLLQGFLEEVCSGKKMKQMDTAYLSGSLACN